MEPAKVQNGIMSRKVIFILASIVIFFVVDLNWVYPPLFNLLPQITAWATAGALAGLQISILIAEWHYMDWQPLGNS
jgi:hypothetical protein